VCSARARYVGMTRDPRPAARMARREGPAKKNATESAKPQTHPPARTEKRIIAINDRTAHDPAPSMPL
jgi:hypothetical protein